MDTLIKADVFFFITTIAVVLLAILFIIVLIYIIRILNDMKYISRRLKKESDLVSEDIAELRAQMRRGGFKLRNLITFFSNIYKRNKRKSK